jgi:hypothetical protein
LHERQCDEQVKYSSRNVHKTALFISPENFSFKSYNNNKVIDMKNKISFNKNKLNTFKAVKTTVEVRGDRTVEFLRCFFTVS